MKRDMIKLDDLIKESYIQEGDVKVAKRKIHAHEVYNDLKTNP